MKILFGVGIVAIVAWLAVFAVWGISSIRFMFIRRRNKKYIEKNGLLCTGSIRAQGVVSIGGNNEEFYSGGKTCILTNMAIKQAIESIGAGK